MNREQIDTFCERGILALTLGALVFGPLATGAVRLQDFVIIEWLAALAALLWIVRVWVSERPQFLWPPVCWAVLAFTLYAVGRYATAEIEYVARQELNRVLVCALIFLIVINNLHGQTNTKVITFTLIFLGMGIAMYSVYQFLSGSDRVWSFVSPYKGRGKGTYICPNHLAGFLEMLLPLALAYAVAGRLKIVTKVLLGYAALVLAAGITVSLSRGGWLATALALLLFVGLLLCRRNFRRAALLLLAVAVISGGLFVTRSTYFRERFKHAFNENAPTRVEDIRFELWRPAVRIWRDHFWFGAGPGHFDQVFGPYRPQTIQPRPDRVHNDYLNTLVDWGVVGVLLVAAAWVLAFIGAVKTWSSVRGGDRDFGTNSSNKFALVLGATAGLAAILVHSVVDFNMHVPANALLAVTLLALLSAHLRYASDRYWLTLRTWLKSVTTLVVLIGVVYLAGQGWRGWQEQRWLARAKNLPFASDEEMAALGHAFAVEPKNAETAYKLGECYRTQSWEGGWTYQQLAEQALDWFTTSMRLNPHDAYAPMRRGMCLDWLERPAEAAQFIQLAAQLDPNNFFIVAHVGWHYEQVGDFAAAREWFKRSYFLQATDNPIAKNHLAIAEKRLAQDAAK